MLTWYLQNNHAHNMRMLAPPIDQLINTLPLENGRRSFTVALMVFFKLLCLEVLKSYLSRLVLGARTSYHPSRLVHTHTQLNFLLPKEFMAHNFPCTPYGGKTSQLNTKVYIGGILEPGQENARYCVHKCVLARYLRWLSAQAICSVLKPLLH